MKQFRIADCGYRIGIVAALYLTMSACGRKMPATTDAKAKPKAWDVVCDSQGHYTFISKYGLWDLEEFDDYYSAVAKRNQIKRIVEWDDENPFPKSGSVVGEEDQELKERRKSIQLRTWKNCPALELQRRDPTKVLRLGPGESAIVEIPIYFPTPSPTPDRRTRS